MSLLNLNKNKIYLDEGYYNTNELICYLNELGETKGGKDLLLKLENRRRNSAKIAAQEKNRVKEKKDLATADKAKLRVYYHVAKDYQVPEMIERSKTLHQATKTNKKIYNKY